MKNQFILVYLLLVILMPCAGFAQAPSFGIASTFVVFTTNGAVTSAAGVRMKGNVGRETGGAISGFGAANVNGKIYYDVGNVTTKSSGDLLSVYNILNAMPITQIHSNIFGNETMSPGVIIVDDASSTKGNISFDAGGDSNAVFVIHIKAALVTAAGFNCYLVNNARSRNIVWVIQGALTFGANNHLLGSFLALDGAVVVGSGCTLEGRLTSTTGAMTLSDLQATIAPGRFKNYFDGTVYNSTDWFDTKNWTIDVPDATSLIYISKNANAVPYYPVISSSSSVIRSATLNNLTIEPGALLTVTNSGNSNLSSKLSISGAIVDSFGIDASAGTIELNGTTLSPQIMPAKLFVNNNVQNLILSNSVTMTGLQNITGSLNFTGSNRTLNTGGFLALKSSATGTAQLADITNGGNSSGNTIVGNVSIERYVSPKRAWRLLSVPIGNSLLNSPTINASWQEGATTDNSNNQSTNPNPGFGTFITGGYTDNGYDIGVNHNPSLKVYDNLTNTLSGIPIGNGTGNGNGTYVPITTYPAYFIFIRGDRGVLLLQGVSTVPSNTVLRIAGTVNTNDQTIPVSAANFTLISNPYPAAIDFGSITKNYVADNFYVWNPQLGTIGGYVTVTKDGSGKYVTVPNTTNTSQYIQSGDAFFVQSSDNTQQSSITIKETDKNSTGSDNVFRPMTTSSSMRINLSAINATDSSLNLVDGIYTSYADTYANAVDNNDVKKIYNINENICIGRDKQLLAFERRQTILSTDTSFIKLYLLKKQKYQLAISAGNMNNYGITAVLKDNYDTAINNRVINLSGAINTINFIVNTDAGSFAIDRFSIVYNIPLTVLPVNFASIEVSRQQKNILLSWKIANEVNIKEYSIETAANISAFAANATVAATFNNGSLATYNWLDINASEGMHYYRIKSVDFSGKEMYSSIVKILVENDQTASAVKAYPNVISDNKITYKLNNIKAGVYNVSLLNVEGRLVKTLVLQHDGTSNTVHYIYLNSTVASGKYILQVTGNSTKYSTSIIKD